MVKKRAKSLEFGYAICALRTVEVAGDEGTRGGAGRSDGGKG